MANPWFPFFINSPESFCNVHIGHDRREITSIGQKTNKAQILFKALNMINSFLCLQAFNLAIQAVQEISCDLSPKVRNINLHLNIFPIMCLISGAELFHFCSRLFVWGDNIGKKLTLKWNERWELGKYHPLREIGMEEGFCYIDRNDKRFKLFPKGSRAGFKGSANTCVGEQNDSYHFVELPSYSLSQMFANPLNPPLGSGT